MTSQDAPSSSTISSFLKETKTAYLEAIKAGRGCEWTVVMGNEAGDLDSIASSTAYAWYASKVKCTRAVPLAQTPRADLHLRAENLHALALAHIDANTDILCVDDIPPTHPFPSTDFALVDHNRLQARFARDNPNARVVAVVDHHEDEGLYRDTADPRVIAVPTGSCASLVTLLFEEHPEAVVPELATLLLCSILIDTSGLKLGGKAEAADRRAASFLLPFVPSMKDVTEASEFTATAAAQEGLPFLQELNATLQEKKASVAHLNTLDLLRRDFKEYNLTPAHAPSGEILVGLSSVPIGFKSWLSHHPDFWSLTEKFMEERGLAALGILTSFRDSEKVTKSGKAKHRREQMYIVRGDEKLAHRLFDALEECEELKLKRKTFPDYGVHKGFSTGIRARVWRQKNLDATRKATAPLVKNIIEGRSKVANL